MSSRSVTFEVSTLEGAISSSENAYRGWLTYKTQDNQQRIASACLARDTGLPVMDPSSRSELRSSALKETGSSSPRIVIVDDEPIVAVTLAEIVRRRGFTSVWFTDSLAALAFLTDNTVDLLLSDINMPGMDGISLAVHTRQVQPSCQILLLSAVSENPETVERLNVTKITVQLESKPIAIELLVSILTELLLREAACLLGKQAKVR